MQAGALFSQLTDELPGLQVINRESSSLESLSPHLHFDSHSSTWPRSPAFSVTSSGGHTKLSPVWSSLCCCRWGVSGTQEASLQPVETHECVYYGFEENSRGLDGAVQKGARIGRWLPCLDFILTEIYFPIITAQVTVSCSFLWFSDCLFALPWRCLGVRYGTLFAFSHSGLPMPLPELEKKN